MKTKRTLIIATVLVALAALMTLGILRGTRQVQAQDQIPPPVGERISFGMIGITQGQTIRLNVVNPFPPGPPDREPQTYRVVMTFLDAEGHRLRSRDGSIIRRAVDLEAGKATFLDLNADDIQWPPGPVRLQLRAVVNAQPPPVGESTEDPPPMGDRIVTSVEVFNNATAKSVFVLLGPPPVPCHDCNAINN